MKRRIRILCLCLLFFLVNKITLAAALSADAYYKKAMSYSYMQPYQALNVLKEAYKLYPTNSKIITEMNVRAGVILNWSILSHRNGDFAPAINGYNTIIGTPGIYKSLKDTASLYIVQAMQNKKLVYADEYYKKAMSYSYMQPYQALNVLKEAYSFYPNDTKIKAEMNVRAGVILSWSISSHRKGDFVPAINGYNTIIGTIGLNKSLKDTASLYLNQAKENRVLTYPDEYYKKISGLVYSNPYNALNLSKEALRFYPSDTRFKSQIVLSAGVILDWSIGSHRIGDFEAAINGYNTVIGVVDYSRSLYEKAVVLKLAAEKGIVYNDSNKYLYKTKYNITVDNFAKTQAAMSPVTDTYTGNWDPAKYEDILYYVNPDNFIGNEQIYQFMVLSSPACLDVTEINNVLINKGVFEGKGQAFSTAAYKYSLNEVYLIAHALHETGNGTSILAKGVLYNGKIVYNIFACCAYDSDPIGAGAKFAYDHGWFTVEDAIIGGAEFIKNSYVGKGQDTLYEMRWNPANPTSYHRYATDIGWAYKQARFINNILGQVRKCIITFDIPEFAK